MEHIARHGRRRILTAFISLGDGEDFDAALLDQMTPELIFRPDMITAELLERGRTDEVARTLHAILIRSGT